MASTTVSRPASSRLPAMKCRTSKAALVAAWSFSSSLTRPRQKSEEITSVGRKCFAANVDFPEPETPTSVTRQSSGILMALIGRTPPSAWAVRPRHRRGRWGRIAPRSRDARATPSAHDCELGAGPFEAVVPVAQGAGGEGLEAHVVLEVGRRDDDVRRMGVGEHDSLEAVEAGLVEMLDHLDDGGEIESLEAPITVGE